MMSGGHGGSRPGAGRPPGAKNRATKDAKAQLSEMARALVPDVLRVFHEILLNEEQSGPARVAAGNAILDRAYGRARQASDDDDDEAPPLSIKIDVRPAKGDVRVTKSEQPAGDVSGAGE